MVRERKNVQESSSQLISRGKSRRDIQRATCGASPHLAWDAPRCQPSKSQCYALTLFTDTDCFSWTALAACQLLLLHNKEELIRRNSRKTRGGFIVASGGHGFDEQVGAVHLAAGSNLVRLARLAGPGQLRGRGVHLQALDPENNLGTTGPALIFGNIP